jgi:nitroreductase
MLLAPSSYGLQPWKAIVVTDPEVRAKLVGAAYGQRQVADASLLVVLAIKTNLGDADVEAYLQRIAAVRGAPIASLEGFRGLLTGAILKGMDEPTRRAWSARQAYIALGTLLTSAALLGIDVGPMEGFVPAQVDEILGLGARGLTSVVFAAVGYRSADDKYASVKKVRPEKGDAVIRV